MKHLHALRQRIQHAVATLRRAWYVLTHIDSMMDRHDMAAKNLGNRLAAIENLVRDSMHLDVDIPGGPRHPTSVIVSGRLGGRTIVQTFSLHPADFESLCRDLQRMTQYGRIRHVDCPPHIRASFDDRMYRF